LILAIALCFASIDRAQTTSATDNSPDKFLQELNAKYPGLLADVSHLLGRLQNDIHYPSPRTDGRLLRLLPESTEFYVAIPNYGDATHQAAEVLRSEMKERTALHDWIAKNQEWSKLEPKIEETLDRLAEAQEYLGNEIVFSGALTERAPSLVFLTEVRKPGFKELVEKNLKELSVKSKPGVRLVDPRELHSAEFNKHSDDLLIMVRSDYVVCASDITTLRAMAARLDHRTSSRDATTAFQERLAKEYTRGVSTLAGADLHRVMKHLPPIVQRETGSLQRNGFGDLQYLIWSRKSSEKETFGNAELSFASPRKGAAAWLGNSRRLTTLDFVSPEANMAVTLVLRHPAQMFDEIRTMAGPTNNSFAALSQFESMLKVSVKDDILANLNGELTIEADGIGTTTPTWRVIFGAKDSEHLKQTLETLLKSSPFTPQRFEQDGITYTSIDIPRGNPARSGESAPPPMKVGYAFCDGRLIFGSGGDAVAEGVRLHRKGESLEKSQALLTRVPPGYSLEASALFFQDPKTMWSVQLQRLSPELAKAASQLFGQGSPSVTFFYADDTSIREASQSSATDVTTMMVVAAIAIPNLLRSRMAANEASAVGSLRTINTAEAVYATEYPERGYAPSLGKLGPNPADAGKPTAEHADLIDESLASENCTPDGWCTKSGYRFNLESACKTNPCVEYVATATPSVAASTGVRSFCSTSDGVIRMKPAAGTLTTPLTVAECRKWEAVN